MLYIDNLRMVYGGSVELHKVHTYEYKCNMNTNKLGVVELLDKYEVECCDKDFVAWLDEGVLACLDKNNKDYLYIYILHAHPLEYLLE